MINIPHTGHWDRFADIIIDRLAARDVLLVPHDFTNRAVTGVVADRS